MDWTIYKKLDEKRGEEIEEIKGKKLKVNISLYIQFYFFSKLLASFERS